MSCFQYYSNVWLNKQSKIIIKLRQTTFILTFVVTLEEIFNLISLLKRQNLNKNQLSSNN